MTDQAVDKRITRFIWVFTAIVFALVIILHELPKMEYQPSWVTFLPKLNAMINGSVFVLLITSLLAIKQKKISLHKKLNTTAMVLSVLFLLSYVLNHYFSGDTKYGGDMTGLYYFVLISHVLLAGISLPMILFSYYYGYLNLVNKHKNLVRFTYPIWVYVAFTGVLIYLFLSPYYV
jgi:putative membrane protein